MKTTNEILALFLGTIFTLVLFRLDAQIDTDPLPYGGNQLMREFICDEMIYPEQALEGNTEGTVEIAFTVMSNGNKVNYRVMTSVSPELDAEALRICKLIMFYPAVKSSNQIISDVVIPVKFNIKKYKRNCKQMGLDTFVAWQGEVDESMIVYATKTLDKMPEPSFSNPKMNFEKFIVDNLKYPDIAFRQSITGEVVLNFVVETSGRISNIEVVSPLGGGCTEEAVQLVKKILWKPGIKNNKAVRSFMTASISFSLDSNTRHKYLPNNNNTTM